MNPFLSWVLFIALVGAGYYVYAKPTLPWDAKKVAPPLTATKGGSASSGAEKAPKPEKEKKKKKAASRSQPVIQPKVVVSSDGDSDNEAVEEDPKEAIRRLHALKSGVPLGGSQSSTTSKATKARGRQTASQKQALAAPANTSRASSTGADADIDEGSSRRISSSDPSDMLEPPAPGPRVMTITPPVHPPREKKARVESTSPQPGTHYKKNQKKKEKAKQAREEELSQLKANLEQHRAEQKAAAATKQKSIPLVAPPAESAWTTVNGRQTSAAPKATSGAAVAGFLDTFNTPGPASTSDEEPQTHTSYLDQSHWEEIPRHVRDENDWSTVTSKKTKTRAKVEQSAGSESETPAKSEPEKKVRTKPVVTATTSAMVKTKSSNGFEALSDDAGTARSSDWAEVEGWEVHPSA